MQYTKISHFSASAILFAALTLWASKPACAQYTETTIYTFNSADGAAPSGGLIQDSAGSLYGTTSTGGKLTRSCLNGFGCGVLFELTPSSSGWTETVLHDFCSAPNCSDGASPQASLIFDAVGNLYGSAPGNFGQTGEVIFKFTPTSSGWQETVLYTFCSLPLCADGAGPSGVVFDSAGNLYGTTFGGGAYGKGAVFELSPGSSGWTETVLHSFGTGKDGSEPVSGLVLDPAGNLYGTTQIGGAYGYGAVFELTHRSGTWRENLIYSFTGGANGGVPLSPLTLDPQGNLYGTAADGGDLSCQNPYGCGVVFELARQSGGGWKEKTLYSFHGTDGVPWTAGLVLDSAGNLYGTAGGGNETCVDEVGCGLVYMLTPVSQGPWQETVLYSFTGGSDGAAPQSAGLLLDAFGNIYGTAADNPQIGNGLVFELEKASEFAPVRAPTR